LLRVEGLGERGKERGEKKEGGKGGATGTKAMNGKEFKSCGLCDVQFRVK
jgi:hypothetical protein